MKKFLAVMAMAAVAAFAAPALAAMNPFMDVPQGHWAYDAVALLASRGIVSGYPDGAFKGAQPATRYEMASVVARALVNIDADKASKEDLELLKKLVTEFKDELDALGVKVDGIDKRAAVLENGIGGWQIRGTFIFDAKFATDTDNDKYYYNENNLKNDFEKEQFRLYLTKQVSENVYFYAQYRTGADSAGAPSWRNGRGDIDSMRWSHLFVNMTMPYDWELRVGRFTIDFEDDYDLYTDNDALFGDYRTDGFRLTKKWGNFKATGIIGRNNQYDKAGENFYKKPTGEWVDHAVWERVITGDVMNYVLDLNYT
ncbi:MAG: S-layer homology domain-containing protein, partial [Synergistes sp.]|nr:S-layer homology domain-containing protein [Synergistes sp.]